MRDAVATDPLLAFSPEAATREIVDFLRRQRSRSPRSGGFVVGLSGGVDSAVTLGLCLRAADVGDCAVLMLPERHSAPESLELARELAHQWGVGSETLV